MHHMKYFQWNVFDDYDALVSACHTFTTLFQKVDFDISDNFDDILKVIIRIMFVLIRMIVIVIVVESNVGKQLWGEN